MIQGSRICKSDLLPKAGPSRIWGSAVGPESAEWNWVGTEGHRGPSTFL